MKTIYKILRATAWLLTIVTALAIFFGFTAAKGFLIPGLKIDTSIYWHNILLPIFFIPLFYLHSLTGFFILIARHPQWNKKWLKTFAIIIWTLGLVVVIYFYFSAAPTIKNDNVASQNNSVGGNGATIVLSVSEVTKHHSASDCWMIIDNKVYNFTSYLSAHPGGANTMVPYCGKDGSQGYATKDQGTPHSAKADRQLNNYYLGDLNQTVNWP